MSQFIDQLKVVLNQDILDLDKLLSLLSIEKETLKTRNSQKIDTISKNKAQLIKNLEQRSKTKAKLFASSGLGIRPGKVEQALTKLNDAELMALWKSSTEKLAKCKEKNQVNGIVINQSLQRTSRLMNIVRGQKQTPQLYGQKGREQSYSGTHRIGQA